MIILFNTPLNSPIIIIATILFAITSSITVFDKRLQQAVKRKELPADEPMLPFWIAGVYWVHILLLVGLVLLNWKYAILVYVIKFILSVLPALETVGNMLMAPFKKK